MRAKKHLGQNFLKAQPIIDQMIATVCTQTEFVVEIGPGRGALTKDLVKLGKKVIAIEKDPDMVLVLQEKFATEIQLGVLTIVEEDILQWTPKIQNYSVVANIPFYITGAIFEYFLDQENQPKEMIILLQKEVANRILKKDGKESILSLSVGAYAQTKRVTNVARRAFSPAPNVDCTVIHVYNISKDFFAAISENQFFTIVKQGFSHKRKKLLKNLSEYYPKPTLEKAFEVTQLDPNIRAEDITKQDWKNLSLTLESLL